MRICRLDHLVITVSNIERTVAFYEKCGFEKREFKNGRIALHFGKQKINLHQKGHEFEPKANKPTIGSQDLCFIVDGDDIDLIKEELENKGIKVIEGPIDRTGAVSPIRSIYVRDPDDNLLEFSVTKLD